MPYCLLFAIQDLVIEIAGSLWMLWFPPKLSPTKAGTGFPLPFGRYMRMSIFGPSALPVNRTETSLRVAFPSNAFGSSDFTWNFIPGGRFGLRPYTWLLKSSSTSARRFFCQVFASVTFAPLERRRGSDKV